MSFDPMLIFTIAMEQILIFVPVYKTFQKEWKFSRAAIAGFFNIYLIATVLFTCWAVQEPITFYYWRSICAIIVMSFGVLLCRFTIRLDLRILVFTIFLFKNFIDTARVISDMINRFLNVEENIYQVTAGEFIIYVLLILTLIVTVYYRVKPYLLKAVSVTQKIDLWNYLPVVPFVLFLQFRLLNYTEYPTAGRIWTKERILSSIGWIVCIFMIHTVTLIALSEIEEGFVNKERLRTAELLTESQKSQMTRVQLGLDQSRRIRHDFRHHLIVLRGLMERKKVEEAAEYIDEQLGALPPSPLADYCSNSAVNSVLSFYLETAKYAGVEVTTDIRLTGDLPMPEIDFCSILGNLLENALEACKRQTVGQRRIIIALSSIGSSMLALSVKNTYSHEIRKENGQFISSKRNGLGIGTASVRHLAERHNGILKVEYKDGMFETSLFLNPQMKQ